VGFLSKTSKFHEKNNLFAIDVINISCWTEYSSICCYCANVTTFLTNWFMLYWYTKLKNKKKTNTLSIIKLHSVKFVLHSYFTYCTIALFVEVQVFELAIMILNSPDIAFSELRSWVLEFPTTPLNKLLHPTENILLPHLNCINGYWWTWWLGVILLWTSIPSRGK